MKTMVHMMMKMTVMRMAVMTISAKYEFLFCFKNLYFWYWL